MNHLKGPIRVNVLKMKKQKEVSQKHRKIHVGIAGIKSRRRKRSEKFEMHKQ